MRIIKGKAWRRQQEIGILMSLREARIFANDIRRSEDPKPKYEKMASRIESLLKSDGSYRVWPDPQSGDRL